MIKIQQALISVSDKKGLLPFVRALHGYGVRILSTGGTARALREAGLPVREVSDYTGFPEMMDGRLKTLHPKVHGGLLALRDNRDHLEQAKAHGIGMIDLVVVNLYPFESVIRKKNAALAEAVENIDIGGPTMLRAAAKNYRHVAAVCNPARYEEVLAEMDQNSGILSDQLLYKLALEVFEHTSRYDTAIFNYLKGRMNVPDFQSLPPEISFHFDKVQDLRYGENPHQRAAFYKDRGANAGLAALRQLHGKELSFNNLLDLQAAVDNIRDFREPAAVIVKHGNPTGVAAGADLAGAYRGAWSADPVSAFGGIIGLNRKVDAATAGLIVRSGFMECVAAPGFAAGALAALRAKKNLRLLELDLKTVCGDGWDIRKVHGGLLVQDADKEDITPSDLKVVSKKKLTKAQEAAALFGWKVVKNIKSNAICLVKGGKTVGIGCGQTSRVEAVRTAVAKAGARARGAVLVSDAFLPHVDNVQIAAGAGVKVIVQTGGSVADKAVVAEADRHGLVMVFTGKRHFKH
jgi:phosphoribosylaminoimidazolecarboxamide formyltransferase/IMP cyclohydrolase